MAKGLGQQVVEGGFGDQALVLIAFVAWPGPVRPDHSSQYQGGVVEETQRREQNKGSRKGRDLPDGAFPLIKTPFRQNHFMDQMLQKVTHKGPKRDPVNYSKRVWEASWRMLLTLLGKVGGFVVVRVPQRCTK